MSPDKRRSLLVPLLGVVVGTILGTLALRAFPAPAFMSSATFFLVLAFVLLLVGIFLLVRAIRKLGDGSR